MVSIASSALFMILGAWLGLGLTFTGVGLLVCRAARIGLAGADGALRAFWLGWVSALLALQLWHLTLPVDGRALALVALAGIAGLGAHITATVRRWQIVVGTVARNCLPLAVLAVTAVWLANHALGGPRHGDAGAYFIPTVRWLVAYPIERGLANLHVPLAFNQSYFLYVAMLEFGPFAHRSFHLANGLLVLALLARELLAVAQLLRWQRPCAPADAYYALFLPVTISLALGIFLTSPSPDLAVFVLGVVVSAELVTLLGPRARGVDLVAIALLATGGLTVKLSFAGLAGAILAVALIIDWPRGLRAVPGAAAVVALGLVPWVVRNVLLSGCPLYPSTFGALPVPWRVQVDAVAWIKGPMVGGPIWSGLGNLRWAVTRLDSLGWLSWDVVVPMAIVIVTIPVGIVAGLIRLVRRRITGICAGRLLVLLPAVASFLFIGAAAPMPRYAGATFWLLAVQAVMLMMGTAAFEPGRLRRVVAALAVLIATGVLLLREPALLSGLTEFQAPPAPFVTEVPLASGLVVRVPQHGQCWDAPLPCTPSPEPGLRLRHDEDLGSGFVVDRSASPHREQTSSIRPEAAVGSTDGSDLLASDKLNGVGPLDVEWVVERLVQRLSELPRASPAWITASGGDAGALARAAQIEATLPRAGWHRARRSGDPLR